MERTYEIKFTGGRTLTVITDRNEEVMQFAEATMNADEEIISIDQLD